MYKGLPYTVNHPGQSLIYGPFGQSYNNRTLCPLYCTHQYIIEAYYFFTSIIMVVMIVQKEKFWVDPINTHIVIVQDKHHSHRVQYKQ